MGAGSGTWPCPLWGFMAGKLTMCWYIAEIQAARAPHPTVRAVLVRTQHWQVCLSLACIHKGLRLGVMVDHKWCAGEVTSVSGREAQGNSLGVDVLYDDGCRDQVDLAVEHWRPQCLNPLHETQIRTSTPPAFESAHDKVP